MSAERQYSSADVQSGDGILCFYPTQRADGLSKLTNTASSLTLEFERRDDLLTYVHAQLSRDQRDVIAFTDETGHDVSVRPFTVRPRRQLLLHYCADDRRPNRPKYGSETAKTGLRRRWSWYWSY